MKRRIALRLSPPAEIKAMTEIGTLLLKNFSATLTLLEAQSRSSSEAVLKQSAALELLSEQLMAFSGQSILLSEQVSTLSKQVSTLVREVQVLKDLSTQHPPEAQ